jgi:sterol desaturase/sphingolipid hydroxylase (fatty acid hydroxylase superfamily)
MKTEVLVIGCIFLGFILLEIVFTQFFSKKGQKRQDAVVEIFSSSILILFTQPFVLFMGGLAAAIIIPEYKGIIGDWHFIPLFTLFLVFDDMTQYWWHRLSHTVPALYSLHRPHHEASYMSIRIVYRNNVFFYLLMPGLWFSGALIYLGAGWVYAFYLVIKMTVIFGAHSDLQWDKKLYQIKWLSPIMWVLERTISTPSTHSAHHGKHAEDGVTNYKGNFGNLLFFWDVLFGTAKITRKYPKAYGVENLPETSASEQLFWPVVRVKVDE